jgi:hypothetical protein
LLGLPRLPPSSVLRTPSTSRPVGPGDAALHPIPPCPPGICYTAVESASPIQPSRCRRLPTNAYNHIPHPESRPSPARPRNRVAKQVNVTRALIWPSTTAIRRAEPPRSLQSTASLLRTDTKLTASTVFLSQCGLRRCCAMSYFLPGTVVFRAGRAAANCPTTSSGSS